MGSRRRFAASMAALLVLASAVLGCGSGSSYEPGRQGVVHVEIGEWNPGETVAPSQGWPWNMADVPPFPGTLDTSSLGTGHLGVGDSGYGSCTLNFLGVTHKQFQAYAMLLRANGFQLEGLVYYNSDENAAKAKGEAGQIDQLVAVKSPRTLTIWAPSGDGGAVRFDISGLTQPELDAIPVRELGGNVSGNPIPSGHTNPSMPTMPSPDGSIAQDEWPAGWAADVPEPQGCVIDPLGHITADANYMYVVCAFPDADVGHHQDMIKAYVAQLKSAGFAVQSQSPSSVVPGGLEFVTLIKGSVTVAISDTEPIGMTVVGMRR
jgi:hypothetical protein